MKISEIYNIERENSDKIYLFKDGIFYRAYEMSSMLFTEHISAFKVIRHSFKNIGADLVYLGFPQSNLGAIVKRLHLPEPVYHDNYVVIGDFIAKHNFNEWKSSIPSAQDVDEKNDVLMHDKSVTIGNCSFLDLYKNCYDLMSDINRVSKNFDKDYKYSVGGILKEDSLQLCVLSYRIADENDLPQFKDKAIEYLLRMRINMRMLTEHGQLNVGAYMDINKKLELIYLMLKV